MGDGEGVLSPLSPAQAHSGAGLYNPVVSRNVGAQGLPVRDHCTAPAGRGRHPPQFSGECEHGPASACDSWAAAVNTPSCPVSQGNSVKSGSLVHTGLGKESRNTSQPLLGSFTSDSSGRRLHPCRTHLCSKTAATTTTTPLPTTKAHRAPLEIGRSSKSAAAGELERRETLKVWAATGRCLGWEQWERPALSQCGSRSLSFRGREDRSRHQCMDFSLTDEAKTV